MFICSTNLMDDLEQASLRRFAIKVKFGAPHGRLSAYAGCSESDLITIINQYGNLRP